MIEISDHALLRHLECAVGIDVEAARAELEQRFAPIHDVVEPFGIATYSIRAEGLTYIVRGGTVTTVLEPRGFRSRFFALAPRRTAG